MTRHTDAVLPEERVIMSKERRRIQDDRMRRYFIEAACEIIKGEGFAAVSVRNIAERAGYSYATLYNYFSDIKELILYCVTEFQRECTEMVTMQCTRVSAGKERVVRRTIAYVNYFVQYPGVFELLYTERYTGRDFVQETIDLIYSFPERVCSQDWEQLVEEGVFTDERALELQAHLRALVTGLLVLYIIRRRPMEYGEFIQQAERQIRSVLGGVA